MAETIESILAYHEEIARKKGDNPVRVEALEVLGESIALARSEGHLTEDVPPELLQSRIVYVSQESPFKFQSRKKPELLTPTQLVEMAHEEGERFCGFEVPVSKPSKLDIETQIVAEGEGLNIFDLIHFVSITLPRYAKYPGFVKRHNPWLYDQIKVGRLSKSVLQIHEFWGLWDASIRPAYDNGKQLFRDDPLGPILEKGRDEGQIAVPAHARHVPKHSRSAVSMDEQDGLVFPTLAKRLRLSEAIAQGTAAIRRPSVGEFNYAGNLRYAHLGEASTWEGFEDKFGVGARLIGGYSGNGGLSSIGCLPAKAHYDGVAFRPLVVPSLKA